MNTLTPTLRTMMLIICSIFWLSTINAQGEHILIIHDVVGQPDSAVFIDVEIINEELLTGFGFDIPMPEGFTYVAGSAVLNPARTTGGQVISGNTLAGTNMLRIISFTLAGLYAGYDGIIASFVLNTPSQPGYHYLIPQNVIIGSGASGQNMTTGVVAGSITITSSQPLMSGDANCDGSVNVIDVVTSVNFILGTNPQPFCFENADVNGDGSVNVTDVVGIIHIALENTFICGAHTISDIDGNEYNTVQVGTLCWMAENLKTTHYRNGTPVEYPGNDNEAWQTNVEGAYAWYDNDSVWKTAYGALYNWYAVLNPNGLCPAGWRVPADSEWSLLAFAIDQYADPTAIGNQSSIAGGSMKSTQTEPQPHPRWNSPNSGATNESGFSGLPGGRRNSTGTFSTLGNHAYWWSTFPYAGDSAWIRTLFSDHSDVNRNYDLKSAGLSVRCIKNFDPQGTLPTITTMPVTAAAASAASGGIVLSGGGIQMDERGIVWSTNQYPTIEENEGIINILPDVGPFNLFMIDLDPNTAYYVRAYASNNNGRVYGNQWEFTTKNFVAPCPETPMVIDIDGNIYNTVLYDSLCWMTENLKTTKYRNNIPIEYPGSNSSAWQNNTTGAYAWYDNDITWKDKYGALYNWYAVNNPNGICPEGWRVPDEAELIDLATFAGSPATGNAKYLKSCRQVNSPLGGDCTTGEHPRWNASWYGIYGNDALNFSALPGGLRFSNATYAGLGTAGYWWSSTSFSATASWYVRMEHNVNHTIHQVNALKNYGLSIRCVRYHLPVNRYLDN